LLELRSIEQTLGLVSFQLGGLHLMQGNLDLLRIYAWTRVAAQ
jgi:hypothetical protein